MEPVNTVIIPYIREDFIGRCLDTLYEYNEPDSFRVILIDQTQKGTHDVVADRAHLYIRVYRNLGFAKAANLGARVADTPYITICNDDVEFISKRWWPGVLETFEKSDKILGVNPACPIWPWWSMGREKGDDVVLMEYKSVFTEDDYDELLEIGKGTIVDGICTWCTVFKREFFDVVGYFDERFYSGGGEDYDLNGRAYQLGYRMVGSNFSWLWHWWGGTKDDLGSKGASMDRPYWNKLGVLWPEGFDIWGKCPPRVPEVARIQL